MLLPFSIHSLKPPWSALERRQSPCQLRAQPLYRFSRLHPPGTVHPNDSTLAAGHANVSATFYLLSPPSRAGPDQNPPVPLYAVNGWADRLSSQLRIPILPLKRLPYNASSVQNLSARKRSLRPSSACSYTLSVILVREEDCYSPAHHRRPYTIHRNRQGTRC